MKRLRHDESCGIGNRQSSMYAKKSGSWCDGCDRCVVTQGERCPVCGNVQGRCGNKRRRKQ
jgi:rRNA maturation endonuclease Nob1